MIILVVRSLTLRTDSGLRPVLGPVHHVGPVHVDPDDTYTARVGPMKIETVVTYGASDARLGLRGLICPPAALRTGDGSGVHAAL